MKSAWKSLYPRISAQLTAISLHQVRSLEHQFFKNIHCQVSISDSGSFERRNFSSEAAIDRKAGDFTFVTDIFSKPIESNEIQTELDSRNVHLDRETAYLALQSVEGNLETAQRFFNWASDIDRQILRSNSYNLMLRIVAAKGKPVEFWDLVETMQKKGFGISKETYLKVHENLANDGKGDDFGTHLKQVYLHNTHQSEVVKMCPQVCKILNEIEDLEEINKKLLYLRFCLSSELIVSVLENMSSNPRKALMFLEWITVEQSFKLDTTVYNAIAKILPRKDCMKEFLDVLHKIRNAGQKLENDMYLAVMKTFHNKKMISAAIDVYEFAMTGPIKPPESEFLYLLKKIAVSKDLDMALVSKLVRIFVNSHNTFIESTFDGVLKSLRSAGRLEQCGNILKAMEAGGFVADSSVHCEVVAGLCLAGRFDAAFEHVKNLEMIDSVPNLKAWASLVQSHALAGELDKAVSIFREMIKTSDCKKDDGNTFDLLIKRLCKKNRSMDAYKLLKESVEKKRYLPLHKTYNFMIETLVTRCYMKEAVVLLELMKGHGFLPFVEPFIAHASKLDSTINAMGFLKAVTNEKNSNRAMFLQLFRALLDAGKHEFAHDLLSKTPVSVRNHADVLDMFCSSMKPNETVIV